MKNFDLQAFCETIVKVIPDCPIIYKTDRQIIFLGCRLNILNGKAKSERMNFEFDSPGDFLYRLKENGLECSYTEQERIFQEYRKTLQITINQQYHAI